MTITLKTIREAAYASSYTRGNTILKKDMIHNLKIVEMPDEPVTSIYADVEGSYDNVYHTEITYEQVEDQILDYRCECAAYFNYSGMCKHCVALALKFRELDLEHEVQEKEKNVELQCESIFQQKINKNECTTSAALSKLIYQFSMKDKARYFQPKVSGLIELEPTLHRTYKGWKVEFRIGAENKYVLKNLEAFLQAFANREKVTYGKKLGFIHDESAFTNDSLQIIRFIESCWEKRENVRSQLSRHHYENSVPEAVRYLALSTEELVSFLALMTGKNCKLLDETVHSDYIQILEGDPPLKVELQEEGDEGFRLILPKMESYCGKEEMFVRLNSLLYRCTDAFRQDMQELCSYAKSDQNIIFTIGQKDMTAFCGSIYPALQNHMYVKSTVDVEPYLPAEVAIKIYLDMQKGLITCRMEGEYKENTYNLLQPVSISEMFRDVSKESRAVYTAKAYFDGLNEKKELFLEESKEEKVYQFIATGIHQLQQAGDLYISESLKNLTVKRASRVSVGISLSGGLLDLKITTDQLPYDEMEGLLNSYRRRKKFYRLKSGEFLQLEENSLTVLSELSEGLSLTEKQWQKGEAQLPVFRAFYLDQVLRESHKGIEILRSQEFKSLIRNMKNIEDSDYEVPDTFRNVLRNYQKTGYRWLCTLESMSFGGILADDMGLGKTIQIISFLYRKFLESEDNKSGKQYTSLIICPASLVYNWENEIEKFAPDLKVQMIIGLSQERKRRLREYWKYDILITSYDLLKRDVEEYQDISFCCEIIDEAQNIKNHTTQAAKAVKAIRSNLKFALTGTPIENRLSELWSIFDYLMPGMLGSYSSFKAEYELPIVQDKDEIVIRRMQRMIKPFVLRRLKQDVLEDLPDKVENIVYTKLEGEQQILYHANVQNMMDGLSGKTQEEFKTGKLQILAELTRLRQLCCAPQLIYEDYYGPAAKLETCMELIYEAIEGGHKILLFSQFTSMLSIIQQELSKEKIDNYCLTGSTTKEQRAEMVKEFNQNEVPVFLISLKAGGTGLNLTAATIVIHFDPWWNVAAQNQATDRAHRIGQTDTVTVFKLIAKNTIEEKILKLQEAKKDLSDQIISQKGVSVAELKKEDLLELLQP